jgi:hypothetical protein
MRGACDDADLALLKVLLLLLLRKLPGKLLLMLLHGAATVDRGIRKWLRLS